MKITELADYCKSIGIDCEECEHEDECKQLINKLEDISPFGLITLIEIDDELN